MLSTILRYVECIDICKKGSIGINEFAVNIIMYIAGTNIVSIMVFKQGGVLRVWRLWWDGI